MKELKDNIWYKVKDKDFKDFTLDKLIDRDSYNRVKEAYKDYHSLFLKLSLIGEDDGVYKYYYRLNYRTQFNEKFMGSWVDFEDILKEHNIPKIHKVEIDPDMWRDINWATSNPVSELVDKINNKENSKMIDEKVEAVISLVEKHFDKKYEELNKEHLAIFDKIRDADPITKAAKVYLDILNKDLDEFQKRTLDCIPMVYSKTTQDALSEEQHRFDKVVDELCDKQKIVKTLIVSCDNHAERVDVLKKNKII